MKSIPSVYMIGIVLVSFLCSFAIGMPPSQALAQEEAINSSPAIDQMNILRSQNVDPEKNAAADFLRALGPNYGVPGEWRFAWETIEQSTEIPKGPFLELQQTLQFKREKLNSLTTDFWMRDNEPDATKWISNNLEPMQHIANGLKKEQYFMPVGNGNAKQPSFGADPLFFRELSRIGHLYTAKAMAHFGHGEFKRGLNEIHRLNRLGRKTGNGTLHEILRGYALCRNAALAEWRLVFSGNPKREILETYIQYKSKLPTLPTISSCVPIETFFCKEILTLIKEGGFSDLKAPANLDLEIAFKEVDGYFTSIKSVFDLQAKGITTLKGLEEVEANVKKPLPGLWPTKKLITRRLAREIIALVSLNWSIVLKGQLKSQTLIRLSNLAVRLEIHRLKYDAYPQELNELEIDEKQKFILTDPFSEAPFIFKKTATGYKIYSVSVNGKDDGGDGVGIQPSLDILKDDRADIGIEWVVPSKR